MIVLPKNISIFLNIQYNKEKTKGYRKKYLSSRSFREFCFSSQYEKCFQNAKFLNEKGI